MTMGNIKKALPTDPRKYNMNGIIATSPANKIAALVRISDSGKISRGQYIFLINSECVTND